MYYILCPITHITHIITKFVLFLFSTTGCSENDTNCDSQCQFADPEQKICKCSSSTSTALSSKYTYITFEYFNKKF